MWPAVRIACHFLFDDRDVFLFQQSTAFFSFWAVSPEMSHLRPILELFRLSEHSPFGRIMLESGDQPVVFREAEVSYTIKGP